MLKVIQETFSGPVQVTPCNYTDFPGMAFSNGLAAIVLKGRNGTFTSYIPMSSQDMSYPLGFVEELSSNCMLNLMTLIEVCLPHAVFDTYQRLPEHTRAYVLSGY